MRYASLQSQCFKQMFDQFQNTVKRKTNQMMRILRKYAGCWRKE